jgi:hypothetical protein
MHTITTTSPMQGNRTVDAEIDPRDSDLAPIDMAEQALMAAYGSIAHDWKVLQAALVDVDCGDFTEQVLHALAIDAEGSLIQILALPL